MTSFSVVIPAYNREHLIRESLQSVLNQTHAPAQIIVVDDGSKDKTVEIARSLGDKITVIEQENAGPGAARNNGIKHATGDYVAFLDSDDLWLPWALACYASAIEQADSPAFLLSTAVEFEHVEELTAIHEETVQIDRYNDYFSAAGEDFWIGTSVVAVRRDVLEKTGGFNPARVNQEDCDLWLRLGTAPGFVVIRTPVCSGRRWHDQNVSHDVSRNVEGIRYLVSQQQSGNYPGGAARKKECLRIVTRHVRPAAIDCLKHGHISEGWRLYRDSFSWNLSLGRIRFLLGFPVMALKAALAGGGKAK